MPRLRFIEERELDAERRALIASAERTGAPDPRVVRIVRSNAARDEGLVRSLNIVSWEEACELNPALTAKA